MKGSIKSAIEAGRTVLGIEFGSTRIKAVLVDEQCTPVAQGAHDWENRLEDGIWTYTLEDVWSGVQDAYARLAEDVNEKYGVKLKKIGALGFSAMMHGYMPFNAEGKLLVPFRTWRNTITEQAARELTAEFNFNIPQRWSIAHLYQAILNGEEHLPQLAYLTTLAGYVHWRLSGEKVLGAGDASGMFPIDSSTRDYDAALVTKFNELTAKKGFSWKLEDVLPKVLTAGEHAGVLTAEGAKLLDPSGELESGVPMCPPEGDAGTGMAATNSVTVHTGNVSAGTSVFAMVVMDEDEKLKKVHEEIDMVTTPDGLPVAMVHCNNCTSDLNAWVNIFKEFQEAIGVPVDMNELFSVLYNKALEGDADCGGLMAYNYFSGESITGFEEGRPLFMRLPDAKFSLANFMRTHLYTSLGALKVGMDILFKEEGVRLDNIYGHGGLFKTKGVGQRIMAAAINAPVSLMKTAGEGGPWGMALLASYMLNKKAGESLSDFLANEVFHGETGEKLEPKPEDAAGFDEFIKNYRACLPTERAAVDTLK